METRSVEPGGSFQVRLSDLVVGVVGSAFVLDVARRSRNAWGGGMPDPAHALGLVVLTLGVGLGLVVVGHRARRLQDRAEGSRVVWAWAAIWRMLVLGWLAWSVGEVAWTLQANRPAVGSPPIVGLRTDMRLSVIPLMTALGLIGLVLATSPLRTRRRRPGRDQRTARAWPSVLWAAMAGLAVMAVCYGIYPYMILIALEAVSNAMTRVPMIPRMGVADRLARAGFETIPSLVGCLAMAIWLDEDLRSASRDPMTARLPRFWAGVIFRVGTTALAAIGGAFVLFVTVPRLHPSLAEGLASLVEPGSMATVALGFVVLAAGLAASVAARLAAVEEPAVDSPPVSEPVRPSATILLRRFLYGSACLVVAEIATAAILSIRGDTGPHWYIPITLSHWGTIVEFPALWVDFTLSRGWQPLTHQPNEIVLVIAAAWLAIRLVVLLASKKTGCPAPVDLIARDRHAFGRFLGWWVALSTLMIAALPVFAVAGVVLSHIFLWVMAG